MGVAIESKKLVVEEIKDKIQRAKSVAFVDYLGLTVSEVTKLRNDFRAKNCEYKVYKNRLVLKALEQLGYTGLELEGTNAIAFGFEDEVTAPKILMDNKKDFNKMEIKFGIINGEVVDKPTVEKYASIPTKEVLIAQLLSVLNGPARGLAYALSQIAQQN